MRIHPFHCIRPAAGAAASLVGVPYEDLGLLPDATVAGELSRSIDWPQGEPSHVREARMLATRLEEGSLVRDDVPCLYAYRIVSAGGHAMTGVACCCEVGDYLAGTIRRHELTRADVQATRLAHTEALHAQTGPVLLAHRASEQVSHALALACSGEPDLDVVDALGARNLVWRIGPGKAQDALVEAFDALGALYVADGHHRMAAAAELCQRRRAECLASDRSERFLATVFDAGDFELLACNRIVHAGAPQGADELAARLRSIGIEVRPARAAGAPAASHAVGLYADGTWLEVALGEPERGASPVERLDASLLQRNVLEPAFGITDARRDPRMGFVGGILRTDGLERACGAGDVGIALRPADVTDVLTVADAGLTMPPKTTWFEPKPRSGLFCRLV